MKKNTRSHSRKKTIAILYHGVADEAGNHEYFSDQNARVDTDTEETVALVKKIIENNGFATQTVKLVSDDLSAINDIHADYIFNLVDSKKMELKISRILARLSIPFSGSPFSALWTSNNKIRSKALFTKFGIPTPAYSVIEPGTKITRSMLPSKFPLILKPAFEHASVGINTHSVATTFLQVKNRVKDIRAELKQSIICEEFIRGEELQVTVLETESRTEALPIAEMTVKGMKNNKWNIYGFKEKWNKDSKIFQNLHFIAPAKCVTPRVSIAIQRDAIRAFYALGFRDYARFDIRYNRKTKKWFFLEGNSNPGICNAWDDAMTSAINAAGMTLENFILMIIGNRLSEH